MTWKVFCGDYSDLYTGLLLLRARQDGVDAKPETLAQLLRAHVHRGLAFLTSETKDHSISGFMRRWLLTND